MHVSWISERQAAVAFEMVVVAGPLNKYILTYYKMHSKHSTTHKEQ